MSITASFLTLSLTTHYFKKPVTDITDGGTQFKQILSILQYLVLVAGFLGYRLTLYCIRNFALFNHTCIHFRSNREQLTIRKWRKMLVSFVFGRQQSWSIANLYYFLKSIIICFGKMIDCRSFFSLDYINLNI